MVFNIIEQSINAAAIVRLMAGVYLELDELSLEKLQRAVHDMVGNREMLGGLERIRQSYFEAGGVERALEAILEFKGKNSLT